MELVALLSSGEGTWVQVSGLIKYGEWDRIILLGSSFAEKFTSEKPTELIRLAGKINGTEVALSIASGNGKEHMALISALLGMPVGVRFVALTQDGIVYL